jgi:hypothetical protein
VTQHICDDLNNTNISILVGAKFILELLIAYLKQYKISFDVLFQHLKLVVSLCKKLSWVIFTQISPYNYYFFYSILFPYLNRIMARIQLNLLETPTTTNIEQKSMFLHQIYTYRFIQN